MLKTSSIFMFLAAVILSVSFAAAEDLENTNVWGAESADVGNWDTAANWEVYTLDSFFGEMMPTGTYAVPTAADIAQIWSGTVTVDSSNTALVKGLQTSNGNIDITGGSLTVSGIGGTNGYENLNISRGMGVASTVNISGGSLTVTGDTRLNIGVSSSNVEGEGSIGTVNQTGGTVSADLGIFIGEIDNDGVSANGYTVPYPRMEGKGVYNMTGGSLIVTRTDGDFRIGKGIDGEMNVVGPATIDVGRDIYVGAQANVKGVWDVDNATITSRQIRVGANAAAEGVATFKDADITLSNYFYASTAGKSTVNITGSTTLNCPRIYLGSGADANCDATINVYGGTINTNIITIASHANSKGEVNVFDGLVTTTSESYMGQGAGGTSAINLIGGTFLPKYLRMAWAASTTSTFTIAGGGFETDYIIGNTAAAGAKPILKVIGSDPNRIIIKTGRLNFRDIADSEVHFTLDAGGITPIRVLADHVTLDKNTTDFAPTIYLDVTNDFNAEVGDRFTLIQTETEGKTIAIGGAAIVNNVEGVVDFDLEIVSRDGGGEKLEAVVTNIAEGCDLQIGLGNILTGDLNSDCVVNIEDLQILVQDWLVCYDPEGC